MSGGNDGFTNETRIMILSKQNRSEYAANSAMAGKSTVPQIALNKQYHHDMNYNLRFLNCTYLHCCRSSYLKS